MNSVELAQLIDKTAVEMFLNSKTRERAAIRDGWKGLSNNSRRKWREKARSKLEESFRMGILLSNSSDNNSITSILYAGGELR